MHFSPTFSDPEIGIHLIIRFFSLLVIHKIMVLLIVDEIVDEIDLMKYS